MLIDYRRSDDAGDETEVRREPVIESIHDVAQESAGCRLVPRLRSLACDFAELGSMVRGFAREQQRLRSTRCPARCAAMHVEIGFYFTTFLLEQHRQQEIRPEHSAE